ncbi:MAG: ATP-binding protein [Gallionella sp.]|nr:ATP-binding protein [Gallionella sp.]
MKILAKYWFDSSPPRAFALVSLVLVTIMVLVTGYMQSRFLENEFIQHESEVVGEMVRFLAKEELRTDDFDSYMSASSQQRFEQSFSILKNMPGVIRIKLYNADGVVIWSDVKEMIGEKKPRTKERLAEMWKGTPSGIFDPYNPPSHLQYPLPRIRLIEFFVPIAVKKTGANEREAKGLVEVYHSAEELSGTVRHGMLLLWLAITTGGVILFLALFHLFNSVYRRQREVETQFQRLSTEHERIVQMEKLSAMGRMVSEIAHQINNPLVGVINLAQLAERDIDKPERVRELLGEIRKAGSHCSDFVQRMLRFTQPANSRPQQTEVSELVHDTLNLFAQSAATASRIEFDAPTDKIMLCVDPVLLRHALFNLISNAVQSDPNGLIRINILFESYGGINGCAIAVTDHGTGLSTDDLKHMFTPFYTTRQDGTGLGLSVAQHIASTHGGRIYAKNNPEGGARFVIWLPMQTTGALEQQ